jgi:ABC-type uncharacterized transport system involved in gliding motility auxiliary subunit
MNWKILLGTAGIVFLLTGLGIWAVGWTGGYPGIVMGIGLLALLAALATSFRDLQAFAMKRSARYGLMSTAMSIIVIAILVLVALISQNHPTRLDLSENKKFTLASQTKQILAGLEQPVHVVVFYGLMEPVAVEPQRVLDILDEMKRQAAEGMFSYETVNPFQNPETTDAYKEELRRAQNTDVVTFVTRDSGTSGSLTERAQTNTEPDITNAIIRLTRRHDVRVYFLTGHDENDINGTDAFGLNALKLDLEKLQYTVATYSFSQDLQVPDDCDVLAVCGPKVDLQPEELQAIDAYIRRGGRVLFMVDAAVELPNTVSQLRAYGYDIKNDIVIEAVQVADLRGLLTQQYRLQFDPYPTIGPEGYDKTHNITRGFNLNTRYFSARSVMTRRDLPEGTALTKLVQTSSEVFQTNRGEIIGSWGETDVDAVMQAIRNGEPPEVTFDTGSDTRGPVSLLTVATVDLNRFSNAAPPEDRVNEDQARIAVFGDSDFCANRFFSQGGQAEIALNTVSWLAEQEDLISPELAKQTRNTSIILTPLQKNTILASAVALPLIVIIIGILNAIRRRKFA